MRKRFTDRIHDIAERLIERFAHLLRGDHDILRQTVQQISAADFHFADGRLRKCRADADLDRFRRPLADQQAVLFADVVDDRLIERITADADRLCGDNAAHRDHGDLRRAAADVNDHCAGRIENGQAGAECGCDRLGNKLNRTGACFFGSLLDGTAFNRRYAGGNADNDAGALDERAAERFFDELLKHRRGDIEISDHAVLERLDGNDGAGRSADDLLCLLADGAGLVGAGIDRDDRRLAHDDASAACIDQGIGRTEINSDISGKHGLLLCSVRLRFLYE